MKEQEKQIEEMAKLDIEESAGFYSAFVNDMRISKNKPLSTSKTIMSFDCPKNYILQAIGIPEDSVVLSKEEYEKLQTDMRRLAYQNCNLTIENKNLKEDFDIEILKGKETAEKIFQEINHLIMKDKTTPIWIKEKLVELAKSLGVEIKE